QPDASAVGAIMKSVRLSRGMRLEDVAARSGHSKGFLSKIENGKSSPPIATLLRVAKALDVAPALLLQPAGEAFSAAADPHASVRVTAGERARVTRRGAGYDYWALAAPRLYKSMEPFLITVRPEDVDPRRTFEHPGEEFIFVLGGKMQYKIGDEVFRLETGDSLYFDSSRPHAPVPDLEQVTFLAIFYTPPRPLRSAKKTRGQTARKPGRRHAT
ncbi:MAG TPA: XRE family transcriptional regulator, partial [Polyangiaceae bacterium]|nr:XRE family transcriptional regulator [Polyangiaceae bacterium]